MEANDSSSVVVLDAVRCPACVDIIPDLQQGWSLVLIAGDQPSVLVITERCLVHRCREVRRLRQVFCANGVEVVAAVCTTGSVIETKVAGLKL